VAEGIPFLGFRVFPGTIRLDRSSKRRYVRKTLGVLRALDAGRIDDEAAAASLSALTGFVETADTHRFRQNLLRRLDEREPESAATRRVRAGGAAVRLADRSTYAGGTGGRAPAQTSGNPEPDAPEPQARRRRVLGEGRASCCGS